MNILIIPLYKYDSLNDIKDTIKSISFIDRIIISVDGELTSEQYDYLNKLNNSYEIIFNKKYGLTYSLNQALKFCNSGDIIFRLDFGDLMNSKRVISTIALFQKFNCDVVCGGALIFENNKLIGKRSFNRNKYLKLNSFLFLNPILHPMSAYKFDAINSVGGYREISGCEDYDLWIRLLLKNRKIFVSKDIFGIISIDKNYYKRRSNPSVLYNTAVLRCNVAKNISYFHLIFIKYIFNPIIYLLKSSPFLISIFHSIRNR